MPKSRLRPSAAPTTSAMSVAIATTSACSQSPIEVRREKRLAAELGEVLAGRDPQLRRLGLHDHRDQVGREDHPEQQVAELGAAGDVGGEVAGVDVGDRGDEGGAEEGPEREPGRGRGRRASGARRGRRPPRRAGRPRPWPRRRGPPRPGPRCRRRLHRLSLPLAGGFRSGPGIGVPCGSWLGSPSLAAISSSSSSEM